MKGKIGGILTTIVGAGPLIASIGWAGAIIAGGLIVFLTLLIVKELKKK